MKAFEMLRRAAGRPPGYVARRILREARKHLMGRWLRRELQRLTPGKLARRIGTDSLSSFWSAAAAGLLYSDRDREGLRRLHDGPYAQARVALERRVERILNHEFDLLGSGPVSLGDELDWHRDFKSGQRWKLAPSHKIDYAQLDCPSDVKVAWELSRGHHMITLGQAWLIDRDERAVREFEAQVRSWIRANPPGYGINWACTMEVGLRAVSWVWALALFADAPLHENFLNEVLIALYQHGLWIPDNLEVAHINGNHYVADALGLVACGVLFRALPEGRRWLDLGSNILEQEIRLQIDEDGVDIEASISYHRLVLEIFLTGARWLRCVGRFPSDEYRKKIERMIDFVHSYTLPDGLSPVIGDADDGRVFAFAEAPVRDHRYLLSIGCALFGLSKWKRRSGRFWEDALWFTGPSGLGKYDVLPEDEECNAGLRAFPASGFYVLFSPRQYLFVDAGPVGFKGLGGHGHNDCLSFEWHACGRPILTDSGLFVYTASPELRDRFRSTAFHNTICVDGEEINRFLSPPTLWFLGNDAQPVGVRRSSTGSTLALHAGHTGYRRLKDPVTLFRTWELDRETAILRLTDRLEGTADHLVEFFFHFAPGIKLLLKDESSAEFVLPDGLRLRLNSTSRPQLELVGKDGWFSPSYGVRVPRTVCSASVRVRLPFEVAWMLGVQDC